MPGARVKLDSPHAARLLLIFAVVVWGASFVATKLALAHLGPIPLLGVRLSIGLPLLVGLAWARHARLALSRRDWLALAAAAVVLAAHFFVQISGIEYTTATNTGWLVATSPLFVAALSRVALRERLSRGAVAGFAAATAGILLLVSQGDFSTLGWTGNVGDWLVLASSPSWAIYTVLMRDLLRRHNALALTAAALAPVLLAAWAWVLLSGRGAGLAGLPLHVWGALAFLGVFATALAHGAWQVGVARLGAARSGAYLYLEPIVTTLVALPTLDERLGIAAAIGAVLVLAGLYVAQRGAGGAEG